MLTRPLTCMREMYTFQDDNANVLPLCSPACFALLPSAFCCFTACIDVYGAHSNVHLCCFHTGKSTVTHATPKVSSVATRHHCLVLCPHLPPLLYLPSLQVRPFSSQSVQSFSFLSFSFVMLKSKVIVVSVCFCSLSFKNSFV